MPHMAAQHLKHLGAQDFEGPHFRQNGALGPKWTHMPQVVFGPPLTAPSRPGGPHLVDVVGIGLANAVQCPWCK